MCIRNAASKNPKKFLRIFRKSYISAIQTFLWSLGIYAIALKNNPYKCQKATSSFSKLKSIGGSDSEYSELHSLRKTHWQFYSYLLSEADKKGSFPGSLRILLGIFCSRWVVTCPAASTSTLWFLHHPKLVWCYCTFNSTWTISFHYTDSSVSIMDNGILAYTPWDPSLYLQSTHLCVRHVIKELSLTYLHTSVQTTSFF